MPEADHLRYPHIPYSGKAIPDSYTHPQAGGGSGFKRFEKNRVAQARGLIQGLTSARQSFEAVFASREIVEENLSDYGLILQIESEPGFPLKVESFDQIRATRKRDSIELLNYQTIGSGEKEVTMAAVFVPYGKLYYFEGKIANYGKGNPRKGPMTGDDLWANVRSIGYAALEALWTEKMPLPGPDMDCWWEVWIRRGGFDWEEQFLVECMENGIQTGGSRLQLPEHAIRLVHATREQLEGSLALLNCLAEVRSPRTCSLPFVEMPVEEQAEWQEEALGRIAFAPEAAGAVCLLDVGVNRAHPLLSPALHAGDMHTVDAPSGTADHPTEPHGTQMAGLALYGNLVELMLSGGEWRQGHRLESVKVLKNAGQHEPELYGYVTQYEPFRIRAVRPPWPPGWVRDCRSDTLSYGRRRSVVWSCTRPAGLPGCSRVVTHTG